MLIDRDHLPETPEIKSCDEHGDYQVRYTPISANKLICSEFCEKCFDGKSPDQSQRSLNEQKQNMMERRERRLIKTGISKRLINKTFDDYIATTKGQVKAKAKCLSVATSLIEGLHCPSLILNGSVGTGKTALSACIASAIVETKSVRMKKAIDLVRELKETWQKDNQQTEKEIIKYYSQIDLLIIDEIGVQFGSNTEKLFLFDIIDGRYNESKPTIIISNLGIKAVTETIGERVIDRLREDGGEIISFDWDSYRSK